MSEHQSEVEALLGGALSARVVGRVGTQPMRDALEVVGAMPEGAAADALVARIERGGGVVSHRKVRDGRVESALGDEEVFGPARASAVELLELTGPALTQQAGELAGTLTARWVAAQIDQRSVGLGPGAAWTGGKLARFGKDTSSSEPKPHLVLLHGVLSSPASAFASLRGFGLERLERRFDVWAFAQPTLTQSPIANATALAQALAAEVPSGAKLRVLAHSRGGLVSELLARLAVTKGDRDAHRKHLAAWAKKLPNVPEKPHALGGDRARKLLEELEGLDAALETLSSKAITIDRIVRAGSPMAGSHLAGRRAQLAIEILATAARVLVKLSGTPTLGLLADACAALAMGFAVDTYDPDQLPGLGQMRPQSELVYILSSLGAATGHKPSVPTVALGSAWSEGGVRAPLGVFELAGRLFHGGRHDLAVTTDAMVFAESRDAKHFTSRVRKQRSVTHLEYFAQRDRGDAVDEVLGALLADGIDDASIRRVVDGLDGTLRAFSMPSPSTTAATAPKGAPYTLRLHRRFFEGERVRPEHEPWLEGFRDDLATIDLVTGDAVAPCVDQTAVFEVVRVAANGKKARFVAGTYHAGDEPPGPIQGDLSLESVDAERLVDALVRWARSADVDGPAAITAFPLVGGTPSPVVEALSPLERCFAGFGLWPIAGLPPRRAFDVRVVHGSAHGLLEREARSKGPDACAGRRCIVAFHREGEPLSRMLSDLERVARLHGGAGRLEAAGRLPRPGAFVTVPDTCEADARVDLLLVGIAPDATGGAGLREPSRLALASWLAAQPPCEPGCPLDVIVLLPGQSSWERTTVEEAVAVLLEVVPAALAEVGDRRSATVSFVERYEDLAIRAGHAALATVAASDGGARWRYLGITQVNGFYGPRPLRAELGQSWARLRVTRGTHDAVLSAALVDGRAGTRPFRIARPGPERRPALPGDLVQALRAFDGLLLELDESSAAYPWEEAHFDDGETLCEALAVVRLLAGAERLASAPEVPERTALVVGNPTGDLPGAEAEAAEIAEELRSRRWKVMPASDVREALLFGRHGIVHLATHGSADRGGQVWVGKGRGDTFGVAELRSLRHAPAVLVLSACDAGRLDASARASLVPNLAQAALTSGVRIFVGAVAPVDDGSARAFMRTFYGSLLAGASLGVATHHARRAARKVERGTTWRKFQIWGDPELRLREGRPGIVHEARRPFVHGKEIEAFCTTVVGDSQLLPPAARGELLDRLREAEAALAGETLPGEAAARVGLGRAFSQLGDFAASERHLARAFQDRSVRADTVLWRWMVRARRAWQDGDVEGVRRAAGALDPLAAACPIYREDVWRVHAWVALAGPGPWDVRQLGPAPASLEGVLWAGAPASRMNGPRGSGGGALGRVVDGVIGRWGSRKGGWPPKTDVDALRALLDAHLVPRADLLLAMRGYDLFHGAARFLGDERWQALADHLADRFEAKDVLTGRAPAARVEATKSFSVEPKHVRPRGSRRCASAITDGEDRYAALFVRGLGMTIRYRHKPGKGPGHLVLLHGHSSSLKELDALWPHLGKRHVWALDFPSCGGSSDLDWMSVRRAYGGQYDLLTLHRDLVGELVRQVVKPQADASVRVAGGSLGGNVALWLARAPEPYRWLEKVIAWSPGSAWAVGPGHVAARGTLETRASYPWGQADKEKHLELVFAKPLAHPLPCHHPQPHYWYASSWGGGPRAPLEALRVPDGPTFPTHYPPMTNRKREAIECALAQAWESYSGVRARWHWKMALEQTTFSHRSFAHELRGKNVELLAGDLDDEVPVRLTSATRELASRIRAPFELVRGAGHSLHAEVPKWLATRLER